MGVHLAALTALLLALAPAAAARAASGCLACHASHETGKGSCTDCHRGDARTDRKNVAHRDLIPGAYAWFTRPDSPVVRGGKRRIETSFCRRCHGWQGRGNALAANLDEVPAVSTPVRIHESIRTPAAYMPDFGFDDAQIREIVNAILSAGAGSGGNTRGEVPVVVHFEDSVDRSALLFPRRCGGCHKVLTHAGGGLGAGSVGPNLSGLFTGHYPPTFGTGEPWTPQRLERWIRNPRSVKPEATMPPVPLDAKEREGLMRLLSDGGRFTKTFSDLLPVVPSAARGVRDFPAPAAK